MGRKTKQTPTGWISGNAVCCHHRGEATDKRKRGGILVTNDGFNYSCFNCNFKAGWVPGKLFSKNTRNFLSWIGINDNEIQKLSLEALKQKEDQPKPTKELNLELETKSLPNSCKTFNEWITEGCEDPKFLEVIGYVLERGMELDWFEWMWADENGFRDRIIIPFFQDERIVGWTGRKIVDGKPKYLTTTQPGYVFNIDRQTDDRTVVIVVEGQFDAIAVDGCAIMHNDPNEVQIMRINALAREVIVVPDRDKPGAKMIKTAMEQNWSVSLPEWGDGIKDVADAVKKYGRVYTLFTILKYRVNGQIKLNLLRKKLENVKE